MKRNIASVLFHFGVKVNKPVYLAKSRQRYDKTHNFLLHVPNHALKDMYSV